MDKSKLREQDKPYVNEVVDYLTEKGLNVDLAGSVLKGDKQYTDVDLLARGSLQQMTEAVSGLTGLDAITKPFSKNTFDGLEYQIKHVGGDQLYVGTQINERFDIQVGQTKIDLNLKIK